MRSYAIGDTVEVVGLDLEFDSNAYHGQVGQVVQPDRGQPTGTYKVMFSMQPREVASFAWYELRASQLTLDLHGPLAGQHCPCENGHCPHHDIDAGEGCRNHAEGDLIGRDPIMMFLGPCCRACAEALAQEAPQYVMTPIGTATVYEG